jgi:predicted esterase
MLLLGVGGFSGAILFRAMVPLSNLEAIPDLSRTRILLSAGKFDPIAQPQIVGALAGLFRRAGAGVTVEIQPSGHELTAADVASARSWLE